MRRRTVVQWTGVAATLGMTGCLGLMGDSDDKNASGEDGEGADHGGDDGPTEGDEDGDEPQLDGSWRTFQGDSANTGTGEGPVRGPTEEPSVEWTVTADDEVWGDPIIVEDTVLAGSWDNHLYAVSLSSGDLLWSHDTGGSLSYPAAAVSKMVFVGGGTEVAALDLETGEPYWTAEVESRVRGGAVVAAERVYVPTQDGLTALSGSDGERQWHIRTGGPVASTPHVTDEAVYFSSGDGNIYAGGLDGEVVWQEFVSKRGGQPSPTVVDGTIFFGWGDGNLYALDADDGTELWKGETGGEEDLAVVDGTVYVAGYPLEALDTETQDVHWTTERPDGRTGNFTVGVDQAYIGTQEASVLAYDRETGEQRWRYQGDYAVKTSVALSDELLVYGDEFGNLVALS